MFADTLLRFDSLYLNYIGVAISALIMIIGYLSYREKISQKIFYLLVFVSLLFETIMLGYQYFASPVLCKFCLGVYGFLWAIMISSSRRYTLMVIPAVLAIFTALSFLTIPKTQAFITQDGTYLIQSPTCPHCLKVKNYFKSHDIAFTKLDINSPEARNFATYMNFGTIPIMIQKEGEFVTIINGDEAILDYFKESQTALTTPQTDTNSIISIDGSASSEKEEGCGFFSIDKVEESCESER
jgi:glutaredoxin